MTEQKLQMYCTPWCGDCRAARQWLESRGIEYEEIDVSSDLGLREKAAAHNNGALHTPTFEYGEAVCVDFRPEHLCKIMGIEYR
ncbi:MAG: glutaredoxin family protein [Coriobacteriia bacterium]|nr:glutaredoxin family protein [Coriobacteriia bacterium]